MHLPATADNAGHDDKFASSVHNGTIHNIMTNVYNTCVCLCVFCGHL